MNKDFETYLKKHPKMVEAMESLDNPDIALALMENSFVSGRISGIEFMNENFFNHSNN